MEKEKSERSLKEVRKKFEQVCKEVRNRFEISLK
jgi:uncharacterized protein YlxP (DUF503 family)